MKGKKKISQWRSYFRGDTGGSSFMEPKNPWASSLLLYYFLLLLIALSNAQLTIFTHRKMIDPLSKNLQLTFLSLPSPQLVFFFLKLISLSYLPAPVCNSLKFFSSPHLLRPPKIFLFFPLSSFSSISQLIFFFPRIIHSSQPPAPPNGQRNIPMPPVTCCCFL